MRGKGWLVLVQVYGSTVVVRLGQLGRLALKSIDRVPKRFQGFAGTTGPSEQRCTLLQQGPASRKGESITYQRAIEAFQGMIEVRLIRGEKRHGRLDPRYKVGINGERLCPSEQFVGFCEIASVERCHPETM